MAGSIYFGCDIWNDKIKHGKHLKKYATWSLQTVSVM